MSELKCNCGRATHTYLSCGPDLPTKPYDRDDELTRLRAENSRLRAALKDFLGVSANMSLLPEERRTQGERIVIALSERAEAALAGEDSNA